MKPEKARPFGRLILHPLLYFLLIALAFVCLLPFYSMLITSTHADSEIARKLLLLPGTHFLDNYERLFHTVNIWRGLVNSLILSVTSTAITLYFSALGGYGFSKFPFRGRGPLLLIVLGTMMIPGQLGIIGFLSSWISFICLTRIGL
ncbi:hypothetical protein N6H14_00300 [Paenibacillus sp. CC-CFT747]|nr:hypothetical protein N6H14_00300 [Paenibacillus sp. CC-CFT747]